MNILISNDDGIKAQGLIELAKSLSKVASVYVVAPDNQKSAASHCISIRGNLKMTKVQVEGATEAYSLSGTPADCVKLGLFVLGKRGITIDAVYSGINHGGNLGTDVMYSGTVSAAAEGLFKGISSVAVSVNSHEAEYFEGACKLAVDVLPKVIENKDKLGVVSINTPNTPVSEIKGVKVAVLGELQYHEWFDVLEESEDSVTYTYASVPEKLDCWTDETDAKLIDEGYATISVVKYDFRDGLGNKEIETWEVQL
ncbi:MAG: 5'/3'-nucleotidase SurE [Firmicutes bacterium]|nr:5'/3'-nucleotidase SurE [Bacillota bacterium]